jgi:Family of unknown function (DUF6131)
LPLRGGAVDRPVDHVPERLRVERLRVAGAGGGSSMIILGLILLIIGLIANIGILTTIGIILLIVGAVLWLLGSMGRPVGGRRWYW